MVTTVYAMTREEASNSEVARRLRQLINQGLSTTPRIVTSGILHNMLDHKTVVLLARQRDSDIILGTITVLFPVQLCGQKAMLEDLVVDENCRRVGIATSLLRTALSVAQQQGCRKAYASSSRESSQKLCAGMGFIQRDSQQLVYDLTVR